MGCDVDDSIHMEIWLGYVQSSELCEGAAQRFQQVSPILFFTLPDIMNYMYVC